MKNVFYSILFSVLLLSFQMCDTKTEENCNYSYKADTTQLKWTAYKFTTRVGVSGTFGKIDSEGLATANSAGAIFQNMTFQIPVTKIDSKNADRDQKIVNSFFGSMKNTQKITGNIKSIDNKNNGNALVTLNLNGISKDLSFKFQTSDSGEFLASSDINLKEWDALPAVNALNKVCSELHAQDGISKLWPDVKVEIKSSLVKECKG